MRLPGRSLVASAVKVDRETGTKIVQAQAAWQTRAFNYYDRVGEIWYAAQFYGKGLSRVRFFPALLDDAGEAQEVTEGPLIPLWNRMQDPGGGRTQMQTEYGRLRFLVGECYLLVSTSAPGDGVWEDDGVERWEMVSKDELIIGDGGRVLKRLLAPGLTAQELEVATTEGPKKEWYKSMPGEATAYRLWNPHPRFSSIADSPMRGVLDVAEELVSLTQAVRARVRSRLAAAGILFLAEEMGLPPLEATGDENVWNDPLTRDLIQAAQAAIKDEGSASAVVPIIMRVKGEYLKEGVGYAHLKIHDPKDTYPETGLRNEAIRRLALGLDMPPEVLLGTADVNHWGAWMIDEQVWQSHLHPVALGYASDMAAAYLRPAAKDIGFADWALVTIGIDNSSVVNHPDRAADAKDLHDKCTISDAALREAAGFGEEDVPTEAEVWRWIGVRTHDSSLALYGVPMVRDTPSGAPSSVPPDTPTETPPADETGGAVEPGPPAAAKTLAILLQGMAEAALERCRELAGAKIRSRTIECKSKACRECAPMIDGLTNAKVASTLGFDRTDGMGIPSAPALVSGGADLFVATARRFGCPDDFAVVLGDLIENHAAVTLYEAQCPRLPTGFISLLQRGNR